jgi:hypothetical protein
MPLYAELKVVGWTSSYVSIQKYLNYLRKNRLSDERANACLDSILLLCLSSGKDPDQIVALGKSAWSETVGALSAYLHELDVAKDELNFRLACATMFLSLNKAF